ncbi:MAG TPA: hypothetical protein VJA18_03465 [Candidatus Nanoarchaeia archaeon]|nr:hypothetical protein [Candidatus Nanoarchaeia archaeon]
MPERYLVVDRLKLSYEGLFNADELYQLIAQFFYEKGWDWYEKMNQTIVTPAGKQVRIVFEPWKNISDYYKLAVSIRLNMIDVKEVSVEHEGKSIRTNQGTIRIIFDGFVVSDRKGKWSEKPIYWFASILFEKYFFRNHYGKAETWMKRDIENLHQKIKTYLNSFKYTYGR